MPPTNTCLAIVTKHNSQNHHATLEPLYRASSDLTYLEKLENSVQSFPNRGCVSWFYSPPEAVKDSIWLVTLQESLNFDETRMDHDEFVVDGATAKPLTDVIDFSSTGCAFDSDQLRQVMTEQGIELAFNPTRPIWLRADGDMLLGSFSLVRDNGHWRADPAKLEQYPIKLQTISANSIIQLENGSGRRYVLNPFAASETRGALDWASDEIVLKRVLQEFRKQNQTVANSLQLTQAAINRAGAFVRQEIPQAALNAHRLLRVRRILETIETKQALVGTLLTELQNLPFVQTQIDALAEAEIQRVRQKTLDELQVERDQTQALNEEQIHLREEAARWQQQCDDHQATMQDLIVNTGAALEEAFAEKLEELLVRPEKELANIALFRAALRLTAQPAPNVTSTVVATHSPASRPRELILPDWPVPDGELIEEEMIFRRKLEEAQAAEGVSVAEAGLLHAAFLSGLLPVLTGDGAYATLKNYAQCIAGGRLLWIPVSAAVIEPEDLLGRYDSAMRRFVPHPNRLIDVLLHAQDSDELFVVVLDGINRAAIDSYLSPLLALLADAWKEKCYRRALSLLHPGEIESACAYQAAAQLIWPPNVLLAGIWAKGALNPPPSISFWERVAFIVAKESQATTRGIAQARHFVKLETWSHWHQKFHQEAVTSSEINALLERLNSKQTLSQGQIRTFTKFYTALSKMCESNFDPLLEICACCLMPQMLTSGQEWELVESKINGLKTMEIEKRIKQLNGLIF
jgi:hypothetical protein